MSPPLKFLVGTRPRVPAGNGAPAFDTHCFIQKTETNNFHVLSYLLPLDVEGIEDKQQSIIDLKTYCPEITLQGFFRFFRALSLQGRLRCWTVT